MNVNITAHSGPFRIAIILAEMVTEIEAFRTISDKGELQAAFDKEKIEFDKLLAIKSITIPHIDIENLVFPTLGPLKEYGEHELEKFNRCFNLLSSLEHVLAPTRFKSVFLTAGNPFQHNPVNGSAIVSWMRRGAQGKPISFQTRPALVPRVIEMRYMIFDEDAHDNIQSKYGNQTALNN